MERFVREVVGGGLALVAGLWLLALFDAGAAGWLLGAGLAALGLAGLVAGIGRRIEVGA